MTFLPAEREIIHRFAEARDMSDPGFVRMLVMGVLSRGSRVDGFLGRAPKDMRISRAKRPKREWEVVQTAEELLILGHDHWRLVKKGYLLDNRLHWILRNLADINFTRVLDTRKYKAIGQANEIIEAIEASLDTG